MRALTILNSKQQKEIWAKIETQWGIDNKPEGVLLENNKDKVYLVTRDFEKILDQNLRIDTVGLYIATKPNDNEIRLSIEGTQLLGQEAKKNIIILTNEETRLWLKGESVETKKEGAGFQIVKHNDDFLGCGKLKNNELLNFMPKTRRILSD